MNKLFYMTCVFVFGLFQTQAQTLKRTCASMEHQEMLFKADPGLKARMTFYEKQAAEWATNNPQNKNAVVITIPVVVHVLWNTASQNISDAQILSQIDVLNEDFARLNADAVNTPAGFAGLGANTQIQFCLAQRDPSGNPTTGIVRKQTSTTSFSSNDNIKKNANGGDNPWDATKYLNIWSGNLSGGLLGYAQFPGGPVATDGVVILYNAFGRVGNVVAPFNKGRTATHEVGHWLNLYHIWGDDGSSCAGSDQVSDTPNQSSENYNCPNFPKTDGCTGTSPGVMFMNYMDYTDDACMNIFTTGQSTRMNSSLNTTRSGLITSLGCVPPGGGTCSVPTGLNATNVTTTTATLNWTAVASATSYNVQYRIVGTTTWTTTTSATNSKNITGLTGNTNYQFKVSAVCSGSTSALSSAYSFNTSSGTCTNGYEPNNTNGTATTIPVNTDLNLLINSSSDIDWYSFKTTSPNTKVKVTLNNLPADYDMKLTNSSNGTTFGTSTNGGTTSESITYNSTTARTYHLKVYGYNGAFNAGSCYTLKVSVSSSNFRNDFTGEISEEEIMPMLSIYPNPVKDILVVQFNSSDAAIGDIRIFDMLGRNVLSKKQGLEKGMNKFDVNLSELNKGIFFIEVNNGVENEIKKLVIDK